MADPITIGGAVLLLGIGLPGRDSNMKLQHADPADVAAFAARCCFPMGKWQDYRPTASQEYRPVGGAYSHHGIDVMFRRRAGGPDTSYPNGTSDGSKLHFCPPGVLVYAVADGYIWNSGEGGTGLFVTIDHGKPWASFYVHLESLLVPKGISRGAGHVAVTKGQPIGTVGWSPRDSRKLRHLHFELWYKGGSESHVDPWPVVKDAPLVG